MSNAVDGSQLESIKGIESCIKEMKACELPSEALVRALCEKLKRHWVAESNVVSVRSPVTIVGDVHGQFYDVLELFRVCGECPNTNYIFTGSYVNRGYFSVQTLTLLLLLKLRYPERITLLRGAHETRALSTVYGLYNETMRNYGNVAVWRLFTDLFDCMNVAAVVDEQCFVVHGGLSPSAETVDQIRVLQRFSEPEAKGTMTDLLWSSPSTEVRGFQRTKGVAGAVFGQDALLRFLRTNGLAQMVRGHELCVDGFRTFWDSKLISVWSAPNFCYRVGNVAAAVEFGEDMRTNFNCFQAAPAFARRTLPFDPCKDMPSYFK
jgi:serine/threonine-protein phosphatase PPG1